MRPTFPLLCVLLVPIALPCFAAPAPSKGKVESSPFTRPLQGEKRYTHVLSRLAFGARPGDVENLKEIGIAAWIDLQLAPQKMDDSVLEAQLSDFRWLSAPPARLTLAFAGDTANFLRRLSRSEIGDFKAPTLSQQQQVTLDRINAANLPERSSIEALGQLSSDKLARAIGSKRQLQEVLVDFWGNHFNVDVKKGVVRALKIPDDRTVIRPRVFGTFRELLGASAQSPAMLFYLDNSRSTREYTLRDGRKRGGLNENYARELMELHTLGVDGGYTQKDVTEVARCFTGWSFDQQSGEFVFRPGAHDQGEKLVLGHTIPANGGQSDGKRVLDILAAHPSTANFIARKLCMRFVADMPPAALVTKIADVFKRTDGDLIATYRALFASPEFLSEGAYRSKIKSPFEFTVSAVRALGGTLDFSSQGAYVRLLATGAASLNQGNNGNKSVGRLPKRPLGVEIANMGQPLFACQPPTGYPENSAKWVSASALVSRLNFALSLTQGRVGDVILSQDTFRPAPVEEMSQALLGGDISPATRGIVESEAQKSPGDGAKLRALLLGSPEFQRR